MDIDPSELKNAVEHMHHCSARLIQSVPIREWFEHETVWEGAVHIFDLEGHPTAFRAYAWSSSIEGSDKRRFFAVLHQPPITSPVDAVRAAIVAEQRGTERKFCPGYVAKMELTDEAYHLIKEHV
jgi:hypothetical protein